MSQLAPRFRRSSFCGDYNCVEVATVPGEALVLVRDSKSSHSDPQSYTHDEWNTFLAGVVAGEFSVESLEA